MPASASPLLRPPLYAGWAAGAPESATRRECGCYADVLVFGHFYPGGCQGKFQGVSL